MTDSTLVPTPLTLHQEPAKPEKLLSAAAQRALAEAATRRADKLSIERAQEHDGPKGVEPTRFGDWERKGIAYDF